MYWGKIVGAALGFLSGRWYFVLLGVLLGHQFDRGMERVAETRGAGGRDADFIDALFAVMGHIAKADGLVTEAEIRAARRTMHSIGLGPDAVRAAIAAFTRGKASDYPLHETVRRFAKRRTQAERSLFLKLQLNAAMAAGPLGRPARARLWEVCQALGFSRVELAQLEAVLRAQQGFANSARGRADRDREADAYQTLGVAATASDADVKRAYRRLMNRIHPDKLAAEDVTETERSAAGRRATEANRAYELIRKRRGI